MMVFSICRDFNIFMVTFRLHMLGKETIFLFLPLFICEYVAGGLLGSPRGLEYTKRPCQILIYLMPSSKLVTTFLFYQTGKNLPLLQVPSIKSQLNHTCSGKNHFFAFVKLIGRFSSNVQHPTNVY